MRGILLVFGACSGPEEVVPTEPSTGEPDGACGDVSAIDVGITGGVVDLDEQPIAGAHVVLEERNWVPGTIHGEADTDEQGRFAMDATNLPVVEGCWGVAVQFYLVGTADDLRDEAPMNSQIIGAYTTGTFAVELGAFPLVLE